MPADATVLADEDGDFPGWVELENTSATEINLANFGLSDEPTSPFKWIFPEAMLQPGGRLVVFLSGKDRRTLPLSDLAPAAAPPDWQPATPGSLLLWLDASATNRVVLEDGRVTRWKDRSGRAYAPSPASALAPEQVPGLVLWLDMADAATQVWEDGGLREWQDKSGHGYHAVQSLVAARPHATAGLSPARLRFDGVDDRLELPDLSGIRTAVVVSREDLTTSEFSVLLGGRETYSFHAGEQRVLLHTLHAAGKRAWLNGGEVNPYRAQAPGGLTTTVITAEPAAASVSLLGSDRLIQQRFWAGEVCEVLLFDRVLDTGERAGLEAYLRAKWRPAEPPAPSTYDALQAIPACQPTLAADATTGLPAIRFDGVDDWLKFPRLDEVRSVVWVARQQRDPILGGGPVLGDAIRWDLHRGDGGQLYHYLNADGGVLGGNSFFDGDEINPALTRLPDRRVVVSTVATNTLTLGMLGSDRLLDGYFWAGDIHEVLLFREPLEAQERERLEAYLRHKWRLPERHLHTSFKMAGGGEWLVLSDSQGRPVDALPPLTVPRGASYARADDGTGTSGFVTEPTPGSTNRSVLQAGVLAAPTLLPPSGLLANGPVTVQISIPASGDLYYTLDGSEPEPPLAAPREVVWFDDGLPDGAQVGAGSQPWTWRVPAAPPRSGQTALLTPSGAGVRRHFFASATDGMTVRPGDTLFVYVWLDPVDPPRGLQVHWHAGDWMYSAAWGEGADWPEVGTATNFVHVGALPSAGAWVRLEVPANTLGLAGHSVDGLALAALDGSAVWDCVGKATIQPGASLPYTGPFALTNNAVVRARAFQAGQLPSPVATATYLFGRAPGLPVVSLAIPPEDFQGSVRGIYALGPGASAYHPNVGANFWKNWERAADFAFFETNGVVAYASAAGLRIHGGYSRSCPQKSLRLYARSRYGPGAFEHAFLPEVPLEEYETLVLRNAGNDWSYARLRNRLGQVSGSELGVDNINSRPVVVYVNGSYWGLYSLSERADEDYLEAHHGVQADTIDVMENGFEVPQGDPAAYLQLYEDCQSMNLADPEVYQAVAARLDVDEYLNYLVTEICLDNSDWPMHNTLSWRPRRPDGQWRWVLKDLDGTFDINNQGADRPTLETALGLNLQEGDALAPMHFLSQLVTNARFRTDLINRFADALNSVFTPEATIRRIDALASSIAPEIPAQIERWRALSNPAWPLPASADGWAAEVERVRQFARNRPEAMRRQLRNVFRLGGEIKLTVRVNDRALGQVRVNRLRLAPGTDPWQGIYFKGIPLELEALPAPGCSFLAWVGLGQAAPLVSFSPEGDFDVEAFFIPGVAPGARAPFELRHGEYRFESLAPDTPAGEYPPGLTLLQSTAADPGLDATFDLPWALPYNLTSRSRVNGLGARGLSLINTGNTQEAPGAGYLGAVVLDLNTEWAGNVRVAWTGGTVTPGERAYAIRLQYRLGTNGVFSDVLDANGEVVQYSRSSIAGDWRRLGPVRLPAAVEGQPRVQLRWLYHRVAGGTKGNRDELRLDDVRVWAEVAKPTLRLQFDPGARQWNFEVGNTFGRPGWLQTSANLVNWSNAASIQATAGGRVTLPFTPDPAGGEQFFRLWFP